MISAMKESLLLRPGLRGPLETKSPAETEAVEERPGKTRLI